MYAIIATGGKQYKVSEGDIITIEKLGKEAGEKVTFDQVLAVSDNGIKVGSDVANASVEASVVKEGRGKKVIVYKYKSLLKLLKFGFAFTGAELVILGVGTVVAFLVSIVVIRFLMSYIRKHDFKVFGWYRIVLGALVLVYFAFR